MDFESLVMKNLLPPDAIKIKDEDGYWIPKHIMESIQLPAVPFNTNFSPDFVIIPVKDGETRIIAILRKGKGSKEIVVKSQPEDTFITALRCVYDIASRVPTNWLHESDDIHLELKNLLSDNFNLANFTHPTFEVISRLGQLPLFNCRVKIKIPNKKKQNTVISNAYSSQTEAFLDLASKINNLDIPVLESKSKAVPSKSKAAITIQPKKKQATVAELSPRKDLRVLHNLVARWRREHGWLLSKPRRSFQEDQRVVTLSRFLAVTDPLRWFEMDHIQRNEIINTISSELSEQAHRMTNDGQLYLMATYIRNMVTPVNLKPGEFVDLGKKWIESVLARGDDPKEIKSILISLKLLRGDEIAGYSLSNRAVSLVENRLKIEYGQHSFGSTVPVETLLALLQS